jgi:hypothetical protein
MLVTAFVVAGCTTLGIVILMLRIGLNKLVKYGWLLDVLVTIGVLLVFQGTATGVLTAALTGGMLSVVLLIIRSVAKWTSSHDLRQEGERFSRTLFDD